MTKHQNNGQHVSTATLSPKEVVLSSVLSTARDNDNNLIVYLDEFKIWQGWRDSNISYLEVLQSEYDKECRALPAPVLGRRGGSKTACVLIPEKAASKFEKESSPYITPIEIH